MTKGLIVLFTILFAIAANAEQYICIPDSATGFAYSKASKSWVQKGFNTQKDKILVSKSKDEKYTFQVGDVGAQFPSFNCKDGFNEPGYLFCTGLGGDFKFNNKNGRYVRTYTTGYFNVLPGINDITDESSDTPYVEIGRCSPF